MSTLAPSRGSEATYLLEQPPTPDLGTRRSIHPDRATAPSDHEHVKRKPTMTTTLSPTKETTTTRLVTTSVVTPTPRPLRNWLRRVRDFWKSVPDEARLDTVQLQREQLVLRLQLK